MRVTALRFRWQVEGFLALNIATMSKSKTDIVASTLWVASALAVVALIVQVWTRYNGPLY
jgi:hypothetical protein